MASERPDRDEARQRGRGIPTIEVGILGPLEVRNGREVIDVGAGRPRALLALLAIHAKEVVPAERLVDALWGERPPDGATHTLVVHVSALRRALEPHRAPRDKGTLLRTQAPGYVLDLPPEAVDAVHFERLAAQGRAALDAGDAEAAASLLGQALALWRGPALLDFCYEDFARTEAARLDEARLAAVEARLDAELALGHHAQIVGELEALTAANPLREAFWSRRMLALYRCGRQAEALRAYQELRHILGEELGLEPSHTLQALEESILGQDADLDWTPSDSSDLGRPRNLPTGVVTFLLTDIEGSAALWEQYPRAMADALARHDELVAKMVDSRGGWLLKSKGEGDATLSVFQWASDALQAAFDLQRELAISPWAQAIGLRVRAAVHTGEAQERDDDYYGPSLNRASRLRALARGGQTFVSQTTAEVAWERLPLGAAIVDLGHHELRGLSRGERVFELSPEHDSQVERAGTADESAQQPLYAPSGDRHVAYEVFGRGPIDLLLLASDFIAIDMCRENPQYADALDFLGSFCRVIRFDRASIGLSDPVSMEDVASLDLWAGDAAAVLDAVGCERVAVMGTNGGGGHAAMVFAATHPARVSALVLFQTYARIHAAPDYPIGWDPVAVREFTDTVTAPDTRDTPKFDLLRTTDPTASADREFQRWFKRVGLHGATPAVARVIRAAQMDADLRHLLPSIQAPTLVLHRADPTTYFSAAFGRYIADHVPDARFAEVPGADNIWWIDGAPIRERIRDFLVGLVPAPPSARVEATALAADIVDRSRIREAGDGGWRQVVDRFHETAASEVARHGGRLARRGGDGVVATFDDPGAAIACAGTLRAAVRDRGNELRAGIHVGEVEVTGDDIRGLAPDIAARASMTAAAGEVLVTSAVPPLVAHAGIAFADRAPRELHRLQEGWQLLRVDRFDLEDES
jgi:class 3 adenylate cyclase